MGKIFDSLKKDNPGLDSHAMNVFMARLLFCFFAEDSGNFLRKNGFLRISLNALRLRMDPTCGNSWNGHLPS